MTGRLYEEFAEWWPIFSAPEDYEEEAGIYADAIAANARREVRTLLELGSGGGNNASFLKERFDLTLSDLSPGMLEVSRKLNPGIEHVQGDMRTVRFDRTFDAVLIHDAIGYMTTVEDLAAAIETAAIHLAPGGIALFVPDDTAETFVPDADCGGHDGDDGRAVRFLEWDHPPEGTTHRTTYVHVFKEGDDITVELDDHTIGLFPRSTWLELIGRAGLGSLRLPYPHSDFDREHDLFAGIKPD